MDLHTAHIADLFDCVRYPYQEQLGAIGRGQAHIVIFCAKGHQWFAFFSHGNLCIKATAFSFCIGLPAPSAKLPISTAAGISVKMIN
jgi:hypothetical protein